MARATRAKPGGAGGKSELRRVKPSGLVPGMERVDSELPPVKGTTARAGGGASANGVAPSVPTATPADNNGQSSKPVKRRKTALTPAELDEFRQLLLEKRRDLVGDVTHLENEAMHQGSSGETSGTSSMPIHMADLGSDTWEQELTLGLIENERGLLREIDEALERIDNRSYGICIATNKPISKSRLRAKPWAKFCIEYARKQERGLS